MFLMATTLPYTIQKYLTGNEVALQEEAAARPDKIINQMFGANNLEEEIFHNELTNTTPLWLGVGDHYDLTTSKMLQDFMVQV
jgi:hypothetical protein